MLAVLKSRYGRIYSEGLNFVLFSFIVYLSELCMPVAQVAERQHLRSASRNLLVAPRFQLNTYGRRAFAVAAPAT